MLRRLFAWLFGRTPKPGRRIGVLIVHGIGTREVGYSEAFRKKLKRHLKRKYHLRTPHTISFEEVFWAGATKSLQSEYQLNNIVYHPQLEQNHIRRFVIESLADAAAFQNIPYGLKNGGETMYERIKRSIAVSIGNLYARVGPDAPLLVIAHSFGGWMMSCYIDDLRRQAADKRKRGQPLTQKEAFESFDTLGGVVTIGCNIPAFVFCMDPGSVDPVDLPGRQLARLERTPDKNGERRCWLNFYSPWDPLGYPLRTINKAYDDTVQDICLKIRPTWPLDFTTPHLGYWTHKAVIQETSALIHDLYEFSDVLHLETGHAISNDEDQAPPQADAAVA
ncbi:MAG: hypothetical protein DCF16_10635 [Alphaproteobacteria bacterium]|nr:MAG: hypothetical protein DCF16_10635 [Alphaproteobacteria bacterium]